MAYAQTGTVLAQILGWASATIVMEVRVDPETRWIQVKRELESNVFERVQVPVPAVLTIQSGINEIRFATLRGIMQAKKKGLRVITAAELNLTAEAVGEKAAKIRHHRLLVPAREKKTVMIEGDAGEAAQALMDKLTKEAGVI